MKKLVYVALVAMVAVIATSCKPKGDAPKASFDYENEGLAVTFSNASTGATSYSWNFGDGSAASTDKEPVHVYAEYGTYTVTLTAKNEFGENTATESVSLIAPVIIVDGDFSDWDAAPAADLAVAETDENNKYEDLYKIKFITDENYIYFYFEFNGAGEEGDWNVDPIDIYMDVDGDTTTGSNSYLWQTSAADILVEGFWSNNYSDAQFYKFPPEADQSEWAWVEAGGVGATTTSDKIDLGNGKAAIEGSIMRAMCPIAITSLRVGVFSSNTAWSESGCLPKHTLNEDGSTTPSALLNVKLK